MSDNNKRILLVEDDRFLRRACEKSLKQLGFNVLTAVDGEEGLAKIRTELPDLVLLDLLMPKLTGIEVLRAMKSEEATRALPVIVLTNSSKEQDIQEIMALGAAGYQVKADLSLEELGATVKRLLEK
jgi:two-component system alkaline phosphatase synthesis response regulator PhoP/two-component system response regulator VicR